MRTQAAQEASTAADAPVLGVRFVSGEAYEVTVRGHRILVDQPAEAGGADIAPTPTELFIASLATCVAFYAGRYLARHGYSRDRLSVAVGYTMAADRPARVAAVVLTLRVPADVPVERRAALQAVALHCTVHNTITNPPDITVDLA